MFPRIPWVTPLICLMISGTHAWSQSLISSAPESATGFSKSFSLEEDPEALMRSPGTYQRDGGGPASLKTLSVRGSDSKDTQVQLEGVSLNSPSSGIFDFGLFSPFGWGEGRLERSGLVNLRLPHQEAVRTSFGLGTSQSLFVGQQIPHAVFSYDQSENDFRGHNAHQRVNLRTWTRGSYWQAWAQLLFVDLELPGPVDYPFLSRTKTLRPTAAAQMRNGPWSLQVSNDFQNQSVQSYGVNRWNTSSLQIQHRASPSDEISVESLFGQSFDKLDSRDFSSPLRASTSITEKVLWAMDEGHLVEPFVKIESISDLAQTLSAQGGVGGRHRISNSTINTLWNLRYVSKSPNFSELYFEIPGIYLSNPSLERQQSLQADWGLEGKWGDSIDLQTAVFATRKKDIMEVVTDNGVSQTRNNGNAMLMGVESSLEVQAHRDLEFEAQYTYQQTYVFQKSQSLWNPSWAENSRSQYYQPRHRLNFTPTFLASRQARISLPLYYRSSVLASSQGTRIDDQVDLGLDFTADAQKLFPFRTKVSIRNLLGWSREESLGYPLSSESSVFVLLTREF